MNSEGFSHDENKVEDVEEMNNSSMMDRVDQEDQQEISKMAENLKEDFLSDINKGSHIEEDD